MLDYPKILAIIEAFYEVAKRDVMIGYHFRVIEDFDSHIPRIADFWNLQLNGQMEARTHLPFDLFGKHAPLKINRGEIGRWVKLFKDNLDTFELTEKDYKLFSDKVDFFATKLDAHFFS